MPARRRLILPRARAALLGVARIGVMLLVACGGEQPSSPAPSAVEGPYALVMGPQTELISLVPGKARVVCRPKPGLEEFELEALPEAAEDAGKYLRFTLKGYTGPQDYQFEYTPGGPGHKVEVGFPALPAAAKSYRYRLFQYFRVDTQVTYRSHCDLSVQARELPDRTHFSGAVSCAALWADFDSLDYVPQPLNGFADLVVRFDCEQPS